MVPIFLGHPVELLHTYTQRERERERERVLLVFLQNDGRMSSLFDAFSCAFPCHYLSRLIDFQFFSLHYYRRTDLNVFAADVFRKISWNIISFCFNKRIVHYNIMMFLDDILYAVLDICVISVQVLHFPPYER